MSNITMRDMLEAGVHFGHQTRYWNPKMAPYIFGERHKIHIINLEKTVPAYHDAVNFLGSVASKNGKILFVGTKRSAQVAIAEEAQRAGMPYVNHRWLGGMLTNYKTVRQSIKRLRDFEKMEEEGQFDRMIKKEGLKMRREMLKLKRSFDGIKNMAGLPDAIFVIDSNEEHIAIQEARRLRIPVVAIVDTNCDPDDVDYLVPGNDDAMRAIRLYLKGVVDAVVNAKETARANSSGREEVIEMDEEDAKAPKRDAKKVTIKSKKEATKEASDAKKTAAKSEEKPAEVKAAPEEKEVAKPEEKKAAPKKAAAKKAPTAKTASTKKAEGKKEEK